MIMLSSSFVIEIVWKAVQNFESVVWTVGEEKVLAKARLPLSLFYKQECQVSSRATPPPSVVEEKELSAAVASPYWAWWLPLPSFLSCNRKDLKMEETVPISGFVFLVMMHKRMLMGLETSSLDSVSLSYWTAHY